MGGYKWTINKGNLLFEGDRRQQVARSYVEDIHHSTINWEIILFNQEKTVVQFWEDIYQH